MKEKASKVVYRQFRKADLAQATAIVNLNYTAADERKCMRELGGMFSETAYDMYRPRGIVAVVGDRLVGFQIYGWSWMDYHIYELFWLNVHPDYQRQGVGRELVNRAIEVVSHQRANNKARLIIFSCRPSLIGYYSRLGFTRLMKFGARNILMGRKLK